eukprot:6719885-Pyramimonas_sp.AAC.1
MGAVPLQGLRANQMGAVLLAVQPTMGPWSYSIEPGRGIEDSLSEERLEGVQSWPEGAPPAPEWS